MRNLLFLVCGLLIAVASLSAADTVWLFTYFTHNGENGIHLCWSEDGYKWRALGEGRSFLTPAVGRKEKLMRDPCVVRGPDGTYHMVWTSGWTENNIGYASTRDFITWSEQRELPVMAHEPGVRNTWAPEIVYDDVRGEFLIFWASTIPGRFNETAGSSESGYNHRIYAVTTKDFRTFSPTRLFYDPGFSVIDATFLRDGSRQWLIVKDETVNPPKKHLRIAAADGLQGALGKLSTAFTPDGIWAEGPTAVKIGKEYLVYFDAYRDRRYRAMRSHDLQVWEDVSAKMEFPFDGAPERMRHGTVIEAPRALVDRLRVPAAQPALNPALPTLFIAGDSTAARNNGNPAQGWGEPFAGYFDPAKINIANRAVGGRSSRTFIAEGLWDKLLAEMKTGDFVLIQLGHNDGGAINEEPPGSKLPLRARGSLPGLGEESQAINNIITKKPEVVRTFGWYVRKMIEDAKAKGATPVLLSLTPRNLWRDGKVERGSGRYREWIRELARGAGIEFIDLTRIVADRYQSLGKEKTADLFGGDFVHTNTAGADLNASSVVAGLKGIRRGPQFSAFLSEKGLAVEADSLGWLNLSEPANPALPTLFLIGDSTIRTGRGDGAGGQWGWGDLLAPLFDSAKLNVVNRAVGGLSSRTFLTQGHWERVRGLLKPGDFVIMQFGHNDNGLLNDNSRARGTIQGVGDEAEEVDNLLTKQCETVHSFGWYLRNYIRETKAGGATPIICSLVPRKIWKDGRIVRATDSHAGWARTVAVEEKVIFIDLNELIAVRYDELGPEKVNALFADAHTHTSLVGAELNARIVVGALRTLPGNPWSGFLKTGD